jgi:hypothetical protein
MNPNPDVPRDIGELSRYALEDAIGKVDRALAGAAPELRAAVSVIRLVSGMPRRAPWYGTPVDPADSSVTAGVAMRNAFEAVGDWPESYGRPAKADHWYTRRYLPLWLAGRRGYYRYLAHLTDPLRYEAELAEQRWTAETYAAAMHHAARLATIPDDRRP